MIIKIFTNDERQILESYLINTKVNKNEAAKLLDQIKTQKSLFEDVFLYLQVKKTLTSWKKLFFNNQLLLHYTKVTTFYLMLNLV